jgi:hypothetical protein
VLSCADDAALYRLIALPGLTAAAVRRILTAWREDAGAAARFWDASPEEYRERWMLPEPVIRPLLANGAPDEERARVLAGEAREAEIELLSLLDSAYHPLASRRGLPGLLFTRGNQDLLWRPSVAILHSRDASDRGLAWGGALAQALARAGITLVSSHNRDGYRQTAAAAKRHASPLVLALDRPLHGLPAEGPRAEPVSSSRLWDDRFRPEKELLLSAIGPGETWRPQHAGDRDLLIARVASVLVAGDVRPGGIIAERCLGAPAADRLVFSSPHCRAVVEAEPLPADPEAAALRIAAGVERLQPVDGGEGTATLGWLARRWESAVREFVEGVRGALDPGGWIEREAVAAGGGGASRTRQAWLRSSLRALVLIPGPPTAGEAEVVGVGDGLPPHAAPRPQVVVIAPEGDVAAPAELRWYLQQAACRVAALLTDPPHPSAPVRGRSLPEDSPPSPE